MLTLPNTLNLSTTPQLGVDFLENSFADTSCISQIIQPAAKSHDIGPLLQLDSPSAAAPPLALRDGLSLDAALAPLASPSLEIPTVWELLIAESKPRKHLKKHMA